MKRFVFEVTALRPKVTTRRELGAFLKIRGADVEQQDSSMPQVAHDAVALGLSAGSEVLAWTKAAPGLAPVAGALERPARALLGSKLGKTALLASDRVVSVADGAIDTAMGTSLFKVTARTVKTTYEFVHVETDVSPALGEERVCRSKPGFQGPAVHALGGGPRCAAVLSTCCIHHRGGFCAGCRDCCQHRPIRPARCWHG
ncbi:MAG: hypothetical protein ACPIOQ_00785 [Promethearchaeia archaeon]